MPREPLAPLVDEIPAGILHAALPTGYPIGPVNCYLLPGDPVTLVDPGMMIPESLAALEALLAEAGLGVADVQQVFVTHGHPDHYGAAGWVAERAGATVLCGAAERHKLLGHRSPEYLALLIDLGMPKDLVDQWPDLRKSNQALIHVPAEHALESRGDGDILAAGGQQWTVVETPGHTASHLSLWHEESRVLFSGDHLLPHVTPNPVLEPQDEAPGRRRSLMEYLDTLGRFTALDPGVVLPGHGSAFTDVAKLEVALRSHHAERAERVVALVAELGSPTPHDVAMKLFPFLEGFGVMLGVSEAIGHLDLLALEGRVRQVDDHPVRFVTA